MLVTYVTQVSSGLQVGYVKSSSLPAITRYFPETKGDLTQIKWGHGVNSRAQLNESLEGK